MFSDFSGKRRGKRPGYLPFILAISIVMASVLAPLGCGSAPPGTGPENPPDPAPAPEQASLHIRAVHLTFRGDPASTMAVNWVSDASTPGSLVQYGTSPDYGAQVEGEQDSRGSELLHTVELTRLDPDTLYYYRCGDGANEWSAGASFRTAPVAGSPGRIVFTAMGDSRNGASTFAQLAEAAHSVQPAFTLFMGDAVDSGASPLQWMDWFTAAGSLDSDAPLLPTLGNHEGNASLYFAQFDLPGNERWYSFDWGNVHVVCLDTEAGLGGEQEQFLRDDLAAANADPAIDWKVVFFHAPPFSSGRGHGSDLDVRKTWCPIFDQYRVDLVLSGHEHNYERSGPVNFSASPNALEPDWSDARCYVVAGGGGAPLTPVTASWWTEKSAALYNWVEVTVSGKALHLETFDLAGSSIDSLDLTKP